MLSRESLMVQRAHVAWQTTTQPAWNSVTSSAGTPRDADMRRIRWLIDQGRLSDHEALYADPAGAEP